MRSMRSSIGCSATRTRPPMKIGAMQPSSFTCSERQRRSQRLIARPRPARGLALLRDARWQVEGSGDVPLLGQPDGLAAAWHLIRLRVRDAFVLAERRSISAALGAAIAGAVAGFVGGLLLVRSPASEAPFTIVPVFGLLGAISGAIGAAGIAAGVGAAEADCAIAAQRGDHRRGGARRFRDRRHRASGDAVDAARTVRPRARADRRTGGRPDAGRCGRLGICGDDQAPWRWRHGRSSRFGSRANRDRGGRLHGRRRFRPLDHRPPAGRRAHQRDCASVERRADDPHATRRPLRRTVVWRRDKDAAGDVRERTVRRSALPPV